MYVYLIKNKINDKRYVGITTRSPQQRFKEHLASSNGKREFNKPFYQAIQKYGKENFILEWYENYSDKIKNFYELEKLESKFIVYYKTYIGFNPCYGYNANYYGGGINPNPLNCRKVCQYDIDTLVLIKKYFSISEASRETESDKTSIYECCKHRNQTAGGFIWAYEGEEPQKLQPTKHFRERVSQYDLFGEFINTYDSIREAAKITNTEHTCISQCCRHDIQTAGGFIWAYEGEIPYTPQFNRQKVVYQYTLDLIFVKKYFTAAEAARETKIQEITISKCCRGKSKTAGGYIWKYEGEIPETITPKISRKGISIKVRSIEQFTLDGKFISYFKTTGDASRSTGIYRRCILDCCSGKQKTAGGYIWRYSIGN